MTLVKRSTNMFEEVTLTFESMFVSNNDIIILLSIYSQCRLDTVEEKNMETKAIKIIR